MLNIYIYIWEKSVQPIFWHYRPSLFFLLHKSFLLFFLFLPFLLGLKQTNKQKALMGYSDCSQPKHNSK